ncbi:hypothetical protein H3N56_02590 [Cetobacterium sp. 2A]|uniref:hypothetical protein n=1 Tax=Cetobacterium sp. 2A TaxID=2754723 RepID=UPI00163BB092|nr:hypothetical protein [Cetobacterium sp. 2A]MBC2855381.1 hypothetical protein [Cetobacterium sp. 2A]
MNMVDILQPFLSMVTPIIGDKAVTKVVELFLANNELIVNIPTWNLKNNFFILKLELQTDRAPMIINEIFIESPDSIIFYASQRTFSQPPKAFGMNDYLFVDASSENNYLSSFTDYFGRVINLNFDFTNKFSIVFKDIPENTNFENWKIHFKVNNKVKTYGLKELIAETPTILSYLRQRGNDIEAMLKNRELMFGSAFK